ncbi:hypothetical protein JCM10908_003516 [Rhodotorula pacifica]|uniref:uncharacterized protein n=1 Tax=Rhodotorula pacifica TaxID=1495444 RepID=UPI00317D6861
MESLYGVKTSQQLGSLLSAYLPLLARSGNPYAVLHASILDAVLPPQSAAAKPLYVLASVGAALDVLLIIAVWLVRWRKHSFWLIRKARSQDKTYFLAHSSLLYSCATVLMCIGMQGYAWCMYRLAKREAVPMTLYWTTLSWLPGILGLIVNAWVMGTAYVLHLRSYADKRNLSIGSPSFLLGTTIAAVVAVIATSLPLALRASAAYSHVIHDWLFAEKVLLEAASRYTGTMSASSPVVDSIAPPLFDLIQRKKHLEHWFRWTFLLYAIWAFLLGAIFCVVGAAYVRALKRSLDDFADRSPTASTVFSQTLRNLVALLLGFTLFLVVVAVNSIWVGVLSFDVLNRGFVMQLSAIIPLLATVAGVLGIALIMLYQALTAPTVYVGPSASRPAAFLRSRAQKHMARTSDVAAHYTRFALAASEFLPDQANLTFAGDLRDAGPAGPFENLELQPTNDADSLKSFDVGERQGRGGPVEGIAVLRQAVTVVSLPKDGMDDIVDEKY